MMTRVCLCVPGAREVVFFRGGRVGGFVDSGPKMPMPSASNRSTREWTLVDSVLSASSVLSARVSGGRGREPRAARGGEVGARSTGDMLEEKTDDHLSSPALCAGPLPLPRCAAERTYERRRGLMRRWEGLFSHSLQGCAGRVAGIG